MFAAGAGERQPLLGDLVAGQQVRVEELLPDEVRGEVDVGLESQSGLHRRFHTILHPSHSQFLLVNRNKYKTIEVETRQVSQQEDRSLALPATTLGAQQVN